MTARDSHLVGYLAALYDYAVNRDGDMFVGCGRYTLKQARDKACWEAGFADFEHYLKDLRCRMMDAEAEGGR